MKTIAHLSDLHFGREDPELENGLIDDLQRLGPSLIVVSGDMTQRARVSQFRSARAFLERLPSPRLVVPGNHDIPLYNLYDRFFRPLDNYRRFISEEVNTLYEDEDLLVIGISTARSNVWKEGRISSEQIEWVRDLLCQAHGRFSVLVAHHPFAPLPHRPGEALVGRSLRALRAFEECGVHLILTGHLHRGHSGDVRDHFHLLDRSVLTAHASTAISHRRRGEPNAYNFLTIDRPSGRVEIETREWNGERFVPAAWTRFRRMDHSWVREEGDPAWAKAKPRD